MAVTLGAAAVGVGIECLTNFEKQGSWLAASVVAAVALQAVAAFFSVGAAVGAAVGVIALLIPSDTFTGQDRIQALGLALLGGTAGYWLAPTLGPILADILTNIHWVVVLN